MLSLTVNKREATEKLAAVRSAGNLPAVLYGPKEETQSVSLDAKAFQKAWREAGESTILSLEGLGEAKEALIHDIAFHPVTDEILHVDFYAIEKGKKLHVSVPLVFTGVAPAVKQKNGTLVKVLHELEIEVLPKDLPQEITVSIESLVDFDSHITVGDVVLPADVVAMTPAEETVASVAAPKEETEESEGGAIDMSAVEVAGEKGKKEEATE